MSRALRRRSVGVTVTVICCWVAALAGCSDLLAPSATEYDTVTITPSLLTNASTMGTLGLSRSAGGVSNGEVAFGSYFTGTAYRAFLWTLGSGMVDAFPSMADSLVAGVSDINDSGTVVGGTERLAFRTSASGLIYLDTLPGDWIKRRTSVSAINNNGISVGSAYQSTTYGYVPVQWSASGALTHLPMDDAYAGGATDINDSGVIVGMLNPPSGGHPLVVQWSAAGLTYLPMLVAAPFNFGGVRAINNAGQAVGWSNTQAGLNRAVMWDIDGSISNLGTLPNDVSSQAFAINDLGQVVGRSTDASGNTRGFIWDSISGMQPLSDGDQAVGISNTGLIVGTSQSEAVYWWAGEAPDTTFHIVSLTCSPNPVTRADTVTCSSSWSPDSIPASEILFEWTFTGDPVRVWPDPLGSPFAAPPPISENGIGTHEWTGPVVLAGSISLSATWQGDQDTASIWMGPLSPRSQPQWGDLQVSFDPLVREMPTDSTTTLYAQPESEPGIGVGVLGANIDLTSNSSSQTLAIRGEPIYEEIRSGPNEGLWYVAGPGSVRSERTLWIRSWLTGGEYPKFSYDRRPGELLTNRALLEAMRANANGNKVKHADSTAYYLGLVAHEGYGQNGASGHQQQIEIAAQSLSSCGRVPQILERVVASSLAIAEERSEIVLTEGRASLYAASGHDRVYGNFTSAPYYEVVPVQTVVDHTYAHETEEYGDQQQQPSNPPHPSYRCSRDY